jgi:predicted aspartyl protease
MRLFVSIAILVLLAGFPARADTACHLLEAASVPMNIDGSGRITVPMMISGKPMNMMVDTGNPMSMLTFKTAQSLGLDIRHVDIGGAGVATFTMRGGMVVSEYTKAPDVAIGLLKTDSMGFGILPIASAGDQVDGLLGNDIMGNYDVDFDFANGKLNLFSQDHCPGAVAYWTRGPVAVVPFTRNIWKHIFLDVDIDGKTTQAVVDTGTARSIGDWEAFEHLFGIDEKSPGVKSENGQYTYPFKTLTFGGVTVNNPDITLLPDSGRPEQNTMLLGINVLRQLHIYIAEGEKKLYITPASAH